MAKDKTSFLLYCDLIHTVKKMDKDKAGELFLTILEYVNDENPVVEDTIIDLVFEPIKQQLKRDLKSYEKICERNSLNGSKGGRPKTDNPIKPKKPTGLSRNPSKPKKADTDTDTDTDNDILKREFKFKDEIRTYKNIYDADTMKAFFNYWSEPNTSKKKMRFEMQKTWHTGKRLSTWINNNYAK